MRDEDMIGFPQQLIGYDDDDGVGRRRRSEPGQQRRSLALRDFRDGPRTIASAIPGIPSSGPRAKPGGLSVSVFNLTSGVRLVATAQVQAPMNPVRLLATVGRNGVSATGLITIDSIKFGSEEQTINAGTPIELFGPTVWNASMVLDEIAAALTMAITMTISAAPTTTDSVVVTWGFVGQTMS